MLSLLLLLLLLLPTCSSADGQLHAIAVSQQQLRPSLLLP
jgi:hypothetical protein